jgi:hypothetical protein
MKHSRHQVKRSRRADRLFRILSRLGILFFAFAPTSRAADNPQPATTQLAPIDPAFAPSIITLHYKNAPLEDVLDDFAKQAGADLGVNSPEVVNFARGKRIDVDVDHVDFWQALESLQRAGEIMPDCDPISGQLKLFPRHDQPGFYFRGDLSKTIGPCRIMPAFSIETRRVIYGQGDDNRVRLEMHVLFEPRFHVTGFSSEHWLDEIDDENGKPLKPRGDDEITLVRNSPWYWQVTATADEPTDAGRLPGKFNGHFDFKTDTGTHTVAFEFDRLPTIPMSNARTQMVFSSHRLREDPMAQSPGQAQFTPAAISLQYDNAPLQNILDDFSKQTGLDLGIHQPAIVDFAKSRQAGIHLDHADFWASMRAVCAASGLVLDTEKYPGPMSFRVPASGSSDLVFNEFSQSRGPSMITPLSCTLSRGIFSNASFIPAPLSVSMELAAITDPALHYIPATSNIWIDQAIDNHGTVLLRNQTVNVGESWYRPFPVYLDRLPTMGSKITLNGEMQYTVPSQSHPVEIADLMQPDGKTFTARGCRIVFRPLVKTVSGFNQPIWLTCPHSIDAEIEKNMVSSIIFFNETAQPLQLGQSAMSTIASSDKEHIEQVMIAIPAQITGWPQGSPKSAKWDIVTETKRLIVPFVLKDVPLPAEP